MDRLLDDNSHFFIRDLLEMMCEVLAGRDYSTYEHTIRVASLSQQIGSKMCLPEEELKILELAGLVHDIGKTAIPDDILLKPDFFNDQDRKIMEYHPLIGARLFAKRLIDDKITKIILHHHERLDGSGYPLGLRANEIGTLARITAVADVFEALTAKRPYKKPVPLKDAFHILKQEAATNRLDRDAVEALVGLGADFLLLQPKYTAPISGFMQEIELFRRDSFFRDPVSELYNYRQLLILDDSKLLGEAGNSGYQLQLITFRDLSRFQQEYGFIVANQVHEEVGQRLQETVATFREKRLYYEGSIMLFRKHCDYLIYAEGDRERGLNEFSAEVKGEIELLYREWGFEAKCFRKWFDRSVSVEEALSQIFGLETISGDNCNK